MCFSSLFIFDFWGFLLYLFRLSYAFNTFVGFFLEFLDIFQWEWLSEYLVHLFSEMDMTVSTSFIYLFSILIYSITIVPIFPLFPHLLSAPPAPTVNPHTLVHVHGSFIHVLWLVLSPFSHHSFLSPPFLWLSVCSMFPCLRFCFAC